MRLIVLALALLGPPSLLATSVPPSDLRPSPQPPSPPATSVPPGDLRPSGGAGGRPLTIDEVAYRDDLQFLSSDELRGRANGTREIARAAEYIADAMREAGLKPGGDGDSYFQEFPLPDGTAGDDNDPPIRTGKNVIGVLPGKDEKCTSAVVVGAHYDHVGVGRRFSKAPQRAGEIHNGADDNASGTAAVIQMARTAAGNRDRFACSVVFAAFGAEEIGLIGSRHYVSQPTMPIERTVAMINLDMIGRARGRVLISGPERSRKLDRIVREVKPLTTLKLRDFRDGYGDGSSDDTPFVRAGVPAVVFFTGFHDDYHRPTDDWEHIDVGGAGEIAKLALAIAERVMSSR